MPGIPPYQKAHPMKLLRPLVAALALAPLPAICPGRAAELKLLLPLGRTAYQTNERIDVSVVRSSAGGLQAGPLQLLVDGEDGSRAEFAFALPAVEGKPAVATEHLHLNGALLRPGKYTLHAAADGASAEAAIDVHSHVRRSSFKTIDWGSRAAGPEQAVLGDDGMGFNLVLWAYGGNDPDAMIRGGLDSMRCCAMSGGNTIDLRRECDWSDPYALGGGIARLSHAAFEDRTRPNCLGVHIYDEALLTEVKDPTDPSGKRMARTGVPAQERSYRAAFGKEPPKLADMHFDRAEDVARWAEYNRWRLGLLEAAWKLSCFSIRAADPGFLPVNQDEWAWQAFDAGYYFNINRPFPVVSRHALYDYKPGGIFAPPFSFEFGRIRDLHKPEWYLPVWGCGRPDLYRAEQYLSFINNLQGAAKPPDLLAHRPSRTPAAEGIAAVNKAMARFGTVFDTLPVTRPPVAVLYSMSNNLHGRTRDSTESYRGNGHFQHLLYLYIASKILHIPLFPVVEEDVLDGTLADRHKVVLLAGIDYLDPKVVAKLRTFRARGGTVLLSDDSKVAVPGAVPFHFPADGLKLIADMDRWAAGAQWGKWSGAVYANSYFKAAQGVARELRPRLEALGVRPFFDCDQPGVVASRQAQADVEYLFAVNATPDFDSFGWYFLRPVTAALRLPDDGRPVYDALLGGSLAGEFRKEDGALAGTFRFGPGQMRVFARTARPVGGVQVLAPVVSRDYTAAHDPIRVELTAVLVDDCGRPLCGPVPLRVEVTDPLHARRYDLYRATERGVLRLTLPLAANDPPGEWTVTVTELLAGTHGEAHFTCEAAEGCAALAGATRRAVLFGPDRDNLFRFFRTHKDLTILKGSSPWDGPVAERLAKVLAPWDIRCKVVAAADVKRREPTPEEKPTWVDAAGAFDIRGPAVVLGNPDDNLLLRHLRDQKFLPYNPVKDQFPGRGRGFLAWQRDGLAYWGEESVTLVAYDEAGMAEAVGTAYEIATGMEPLTPLALPDRATVLSGATAPRIPPTAATAWHVAFPDRVAALKAVPGGVVALSADGTLRLVRGNGKVAWEKLLDGGESWSLDVARDGSLIAVGTGHRLLAFDLAGKPLFDVAADDCPAHDPRRADGIRFVAVAPDASGVLAGTTANIFTDTAWRASHALALYGPRGERRWSAVSPEERASDKVTVNYLGATFARDGKKAVVLTETTTQGKNEVATRHMARLLDVASGRLGLSLDGTVCVPSGEDLLVADGESQVVELSPAREKVLGRLDCGKAGPVALAPAGDLLAVGTEADGYVHFVQGVSGTLDGKGWRHQEPTRIVKAVLAGPHRLAVVYWGGSLQVFRQDGNCACEQPFAQDVTAAAWEGGRLVVGLADGSLRALETGEKQGRR